MSTIALIIAGGSGHRMGHDIPKQFINVYDKPVIIYTLESFQRHPLVDAIEVVCIDGWHDVLWAYAKQYGITKLKWVISGGATGQESIRNGVHNLESVCQPDDTLIIHAGIRPLVDEFVHSAVIAKCQLYGNAVTSMPYNEQIFVIDNDSAPDHDPETTKQRNNETTAFADVQNAERNLTSHTIEFEWDNDLSFAEVLELMGELPIPPYLNRKAEESDKQTYQTVYSKIKGSVAAPTAGLHFAPSVLI